ncbi:MAG TPA: tetratricopeptide repeat protein, partial [Thermoanaerobaculia bacterium]|nr:tetratricopeptide repeat protein [Thermoanaerobaculia bacterium]
LYNRGTSALASSAFDHAIRDYTEALRLRPGDAKAKRNLEIALVRKQQMEMQSQRQQKQRKGGNDDKERAKPSSPSDGEPRRNAGRPDPEALLRSVQQQEREELQRMKRQRAAGPRVGW